MKKNRVLNIENIHADIVLINGVIYTVDNNNNIYTALAIKNNKIIYVGDCKKAKKFITNKTQVIDLQGKMVLPGFWDTHTHPPGTALTDLYQASLYRTKSIEECIKKVKDFIKDNPHMDIIYGVGWSISIFEKEELILGPKKEHLDRISTEIPIILRSCDGHTIWLNSKAFEKFNITKDTKSPNGGIIELNPNTKELWGSLKEEATMLIPDPKYSKEQYIKALQKFQENMHSYGITGILAMSNSTYGMTPKTYTDLEKLNKLKLRVEYATLLTPDENLEDKINKIKRNKDTLKSKYLKRNTVKIFADGVIECGTARLKDGYKNEQESNYKNYGEFLWDFEKLKQAITTINKEGLQTHIHSIGDESTSIVLDAIEYSRSKLKIGDYRDTITHLQLVHKEDIKRFSNLGVIANIQPYWHFKMPGWWENIETKFLGNKSKEQYPLKSFIKEGVVVSSSSDHYVTDKPNPFYGIQTGVTRNIYDANGFGVKPINHMNDKTYLLNKEERASIDDMIRSFTINGAYTTFMEKQCGSIEVGKYADIIVIDKNILAINPINIENIKVVMTFVDGEMVYSLKDELKEAIS